MKVLIQVPEGLKTKALELSSKYDEAFICLEPCYGACDLRIDEAKRLGCEKIIHFGHSKFMDVGFPVEYIELRYDLDLKPILEKEFSKIENYNSFGLLSTIQFIDCLDDIKSWLESKGKKVVIGGQTLGCKAPEIDADCILFIGSGNFHPLAVQDKSLFIVDYEKQEIRDLNLLRQKFIRQKEVAKKLSEDANTFGILVSTKLGQMNIAKAENIKKRLESKGKKAHILVMDEITPEKIEGIKVDCLINTACPRITDNRAGFKLIINADDITL